MARPTEVEVGEQKAPVIQPGHTFASITDKIGSIVLRRPITGGWVFGMFICFIILQWFLLAVCYLFYKGVGLWGVNIPIGWGFAIVNFVWWIGIGHAGTLISAILLLLRQTWSCRSCCGGKRFAPVPSGCSCFLSTSWSACGWSASSSSWSA